MEGRGGYQNSELISVLDVMNRKKASGLDANTIQMLIALSDFDINKDQRNDKRNIRQW